tara:strand:+ start:11105 stop:11317 length:213 start_codon:yes stop_codon:yes gene_type:complete
MSPPPLSFAVLPKNDGDLQIKIGDLLWDQGEAEWQEASEDEVGDYVSDYYCVARSTLTQHLINISSYCKS